MEYKTVSISASDEFVEKKSRFIGYACPVKTEKEALEFIAEKKSKHWDATHNVYAYSLREGQIFRYSDDGEPQGTAGIPTLDVLRKGEITDTVIVVTRYFGGILLGGGGLVRAYSHGASIAVAAAQPITMKTCLLCRLDCNYNHYGRIQSLIPEEGGIIDDCSFLENISIDFHFPPEMYEHFNKKLADATGGSVKSEIIGEKFFKF